MNFNRVLAVIVRHFYTFKHNLNRLSDSFYWPAMDIILWGLTSQYIQKAGGEVSNLILVLLSGLVFWQIIWRGQYEISVNLLDELWNRNLVNLFSTPLTVNEWIMALILLGVIKMIGAIGFSILLVWLLYSVNLFTFGWLLIPFFISLLIVGWWAGLIVGGLLLRFGQRIETIAWSGVFLLAPFSAIYYPVSSLPSWAQKIAQIIPSSYIFEGMREVVQKGQISYINLTASFLLNLIYIALAYFFFKWCFKKSKEKGLARLE